ncbi:MAG: hypothetical protein ABSD20_16765 [Terriglobales bacterium]
MDDNKLLAAILTVAVNARRPQVPSTEAGKDDWAVVMRDYLKLRGALQEADRDEASAGTAKSLEAWKKL